MIQLTEAQAQTFYENGIWKEWSDDDIVRFQLYQPKLCIPWSRFHEAIQKVLGRSIMTSEFAFAEHLKQEYEGFRPKPTPEEIINMLPKDKTIIVNSSEVPP